MPEYLAPGVYVEEIDVGIRPIEGVSTSTAGMVGVTERGPVNVPMLVTSFAQFQRLFGGYLDFDDYGDACFLPHAVEGFFQNGGKRLFVTRVVADLAANPATHAAVMLYDRGEASAFADTRLLKHARTGDALLLAERTAGLANDDSLRIGDGSGTEYRDLAAASAVEASADRVLALEVPLYRGYAAAATVDELTLVVPGVDPYSAQLAGDHAAGSLTLQLSTATDLDHVTPGSILQVGPLGNREFVEVAAVPVTPAGPRVTLDVPLARDHADTEAVDLVVEGVVGGGGTTLDNVATAGDGLLVVGDTTNFGPGDAIRVLDAVVAGRQEYHLLATFQPMALQLPAYADHPAGEPVTTVTMTDPAAVDPHATTLQAAAAVGDRTLLLAGVGPLAEDDHVRIGPAGPTAEIGVVSAVAGQTITLLHRLALARPIGETLTKVDRAAGAASHLVQDVGDGETTVVLADSGFAADDLVEIGAPSSAATEYQVLDDPTLGVLALDAAQPLTGDHSRGALVGRRDQELQVRALDAGDWGNELRVIADEDSRLTTTVAQNTLAGQPIPLTSVAGVEVGTVLDFGDRLAKVTAITGNTVTVAPQGAPFAVSRNDPVRSREFLLRVEWLKHDRVLRDRTEVLRQLSFDPRHSRYVETVAGRVGGPLRPSDRRPEGQSDFIRVDDQLAAAQAEASIRAGPDRLVEVTSSGQERAAGRFLTGGSNPLAGIVADTYVGADHVDPDQRTGLQTLRNENRISIVAIPGRTDPAIQEALINHCELERYRFCVLDSLPGIDRVRGAALNVVQDQRNLYDSRYAALYYPWLVVRDPFPADPRNPGNFQLPPSGHMLGIYARTDVERGVHKAPANAVIRGIRDLQRKLNKAEHDLLNPSPTNIDVLRDFREEGRGLRVWGARCITSDTDWKYVNVRRLFIFLEQSLDEGTQWVVFEPNDEPLWARVRQSVTAFLTRVWRDGALQGATPEEAFFVKCDRTTMTQDDIDNGRLIVLVGVAPVKPAEFVIIRIFQSTQQAEAQ